MKAENHIGDTVGVIYYNSKTENIDRRIGIITARTISKVVFLILDEAEDLEIVIPAANIKKICKPTEVNNINLD